MPINFRPQQSFQHTMREIAVNREDPCEVIRELVSNAYDAGATDIRVYPFLEKKGVIFFDNGKGLSQDEKETKNGVVPYVAFFSIGKTTKVRGQGIGYKCQGSKLCFASDRVTVITRCEGEKNWRMIKIDSPKTNLDENYDLTPTETSDPWNDLETTAFRDPDDRTLALTTQLNRDFFHEKFTNGTLIVIENFDVQDYEKYFSVGSTDKSYLYNYIRFNTAHGDVRRVKFENSGFTNPDINSVTSHIKTQSAKLQLLMSAATGWELANIPAGYPYLPLTKDDEDLASPHEVSRLRDGRFCSRHATVIDHSGQKYSLVLAIDGKRRTLDAYKELGRQKNSACGIPLSSQRGTFISAHGIKICEYHELFDADALSDFDVLRDNTEHHVFFVDGPFELVTNRNAPAPNAHKVLTDTSFLDKIKAFLNEVRNNRPRGAILKGLIERLSNERTHQREDQYHKMMDHVKASLPDRAQFMIENVALLKDKWFFEPQLGEESFVGALFTLFSHMVDNTHALGKYWHRPLTFKAFGIDAIACKDEKRLTESLEYLEYKHYFTPDIEFNHPFSITSRIVCWDFKDCDIGTQIGDNFNYIGSVKELIHHEGCRIGFTIADIHQKSGLNEIGHTITVTSLKRLLPKTFKIAERKQPSSQVASSAKAVKRSR